MRTSLSTSDRAHPHPWELESGHLRKAGKSPEVQPFTHQVFTGCLPFASMSYALSDKDFRVRAHSSKKEGERDKRTNP